MLMLEVCNARCSIEASRIVQVLSGDFESRGAQNTICADRDRNVAMSVSDDLILRSALRGIC